MTGSLAREPRRTLPTGSTFIRTVAALGGSEAPASQDAFAQRLSRWFDWTQAIALSAALSEAPSRSVAGDGSSVGTGSNSSSSGDFSATSSADEREYARVRAALVQLVTDATVGVTDRPTAPVPVPDPSPPAAIDFAPHAQRYAACQQAMATQIAPLRSRVRASLARGPAARAKLAELDGLMERALGVQERALLATLAGRLAPRFQQLRNQHRAAESALPEQLRDPHRAAESAPPEQLRDSNRPADASPPHQPSGPVQPPRWLNLFLQDMRSLLMAELDMRLQPVAGLLEAGRAPSAPPSP